MPTIGRIQRGAAHAPVGVRVTEGIDAAGRRGDPVAAPSGVAAMATARARAGRARRGRAVAVRDTAPAHQSERGDQHGADGERTWSGDGRGRRRRKNPRLRERGGPPGSNRRLRRAD